ncbi:hypothetical protein [Tamaricihabitans halophyticus]|uniref:hypothetical protein n=1 Tax=Tamaricihabitans halophyticus TaxID=1262583 RepID=UPI0010439180|nr:hypothetical protein [Tamaricihabitans halophyticus]
MAVENVVGRILGSPGYPGRGIPGLRVVAGDLYAGTFHVVYLPSKARLVFSQQVEYSPVGTGRSRIDAWSRRHYATDDLPLQDDERAAMRAIPAMSEGIQAILAGLFVRLNARDPRRRWHMGMAWSNFLPARREPRGYRDDLHMSTLWGADNRWELRWARHPFPEDIIGCLTAPTIGITGAQVREHRHGWDIILNGSTLSLLYGAV